MADDKFNPVRPLIDQKPSKRTWIEEAKAENEVRTPHMSRVVNQEQFYHGSPTKMRQGQWILPTAVTGATKNWSISRPDSVYFTPHYDEATRWAKGQSGGSVYHLENYTQGGTEKGRKTRLEVPQGKHQANVYQVEPVGMIHPDENLAPGAAYVAPAARVLRDATPSHLQADGVQGRMKRRWDVASRELTDVKRQMDNRRQWGEPGWFGKLPGVLRGDQFNG